MGLRDRLAGIKTPVAAQYQLTSCSAGAVNAVYANCHMEGVVSGPGIETVAVSHTSALTPTAKWPQPGQTLPVTVDRDNPSRLKIRWDDIPTTRDQSRQYAQELAEQMRSDAPPTPVVIGDPTRAVPGAPAGGVTPEQAAAALAGYGSGNGSGMQQATAIVLAAHDVPLPAEMTGTPGGTVDLTLDVSPASGAGYTTRMRISFSTAEKRAAVALVGRNLPVLINPAQQDQIVIDTNRL